MPRRDDDALPPWAASFASTFERVARYLELAEGFMLVPVELPDSITADLLVQWLGRRGLPCHSIDINYAAQPRPLLERLREAPANATATLLFIDKLADWLPAALQLLNQQRDLLTREHPRPLLWCGPARFLDLTWRSAPDLWSIATVPIRLPAPTMRGSSSGRTPTPLDRHEALHRLLLAMYAPDELRRLVRYHFAPDVSAHLPGANASMAALTHDLIEVLAQRGLIDEAFFERLRSERPRRYPEIEAVARMWHEAPRRTAHAPVAMTAPDLLHGLLRHPHQLVFVVDADLLRLGATVEDTIDALRGTHTVHVIPLRSMHDEESDWTRHAFPVSRPSHASRPLEVTIVVDAAGQPIGSLDPSQLEVIRRLLEQGLARPFQLVIPVAGTRAAAEAAASSLGDAIRSAGLTVHIVELDTPISRP